MINKNLINFLDQKIQKYERKLYEWIYKNGSNHVMDQWRKVWNNMKIWRKGKYYLWLKYEILDLNYDVRTGEYLPFEQFTLHHDPYIWEHILTQGVYPINKDNHPKGKITKNKIEIEDIFEE